MLHLVVVLACREPVSSHHCVGPPACNTQLFSPAEQARPAAAPRQQYVARTCWLQSTKPQHGAASLINLQALHAERQCSYNILRVSVCLTKKNVQPHRPCCCPNATAQVLNLQTVQCILIKAAVRLVVLALSVPLTLLPDNTLFTTL